MCSPQKNVHSGMYRTGPGPWSAVNASVDEVEWRGESFTGTISCGIQDHMLVDKFKGLVVVIVGGGPFACEIWVIALRHWLSMWL